ncbi:phosphatase PAP2/dual specificity phosphatase family protein [Neisseria sp. Dent CA1/247]|uniref:phosphatase PAP2/dual specificity phosphatase family protein n=1 Tax=Neisseria sp. Dent CA1/247 TaxID=2912675 RepID=UPI001FD4B520|nr:phosphatase PAP2/dual specificity phosphatase family protein [Neisseria sp. Dent CA1/247]UOO77594.1 phosphatase PAP2/dual specificity phosphatase family protein [Neisseria sp. Dent CA1/247]
MKPAFKTTLIKLLAVGVLFYTTYGFTNWFAAQRSGVPEIAFAWEHGIPFWAWTIVPYWSLNVLYALAFFLCADTRRQNRYIAQLLAAQALAVTCFLLFPLQFAWPKPPTDGLSGGLFASLAAFDQPYNQAPSLHIILVLIVGRFYWYRLSRRFRVIWAAWFALIAVSVLTTWQHHFIDVPTGLLAGALVLWALPWRENEAAESPLCARIRVFRRHRLWTGFYLLLALVFAALSAFGGAWLWLLWPAASCLLVAAAYARFGAAAMQKQENGKHTLAAALLLLPHRVGAYLNMRLWLRGQPLSAEVVRGTVHIGSMLALDNFQTALDVCAELPVKRPSENYVFLPMLDMVPPPAVDLARAADVLNKLIERNCAPVLVCCALGYGRSAAVVLTWLLKYGGCADLESALAVVKQARPKMVLPSETEAAVLQAVQHRGG